MDLPEELRISILDSKGESPILHHLNADSSWLFQIPIATSPPPGGFARSRRFFNVVLDPWLSGPQSDVASWFSKQWHAITPRYNSITSVEALCWEVERLLLGEHDFKRQGNAIDAVVISHEFTDHCHEGTLRGFDPGTPIFANDKAIQLIKSWKHFAPSSIHEIPPFTSDWLKTTSPSPPTLPPSISISRLQNPGDFLYYHSAILISFLGPTPPLSSEADLQAGQTLIYTPHGIPVPPTSPFKTCSPPLQPLALLHGLHDVSIPWTGPLLPNTGTQQLNLGARNAVRLQRLIGARYWLCTHDEVKKGGGVVGLLLRRKVLTLEDGLTAEEGEDVRVVDLENGSGLVLV